MFHLFNNNETAFSTIVSVHSAISEEFRMVTDDELCERFRFVDFSVYIIMEPVRHDS